MGILAPNPKTLNLNLAQLATPRRHEPGTADHVRLHPGAEARWRILDGAAAGGAASAAARGQICGAAARFAAAQLCAGGAKSPRPRATENTQRPQHPGQQINLADTASAHSVPGLGLFLPRIASAPLAAPLASASARTRAGRAWPVPARTRLKPARAPRGPLGG